ncbi:histidine phosphatase family protein [Halobacillus litoralis]|uniref:histidine phosphatase family protein n=1 Tax=Halobacillus litoralis TaxID=45668 RepID=UPI002491ADA0|nr:histidine phosphatase family protein [Halobacillus litoralis]
MTKIGWIRHGSTSWNKEKRAQGKSDIPLDDEGKADARKLAERLQSDSWDILYSSPLKRAKETAEYIAEQLGLEIHVDPRLLEVDGGQIEGTTERERIERWGEGWRTLDLGIEDPSSILERSRDFIEEIIQKHEKMNIIVVSHGAFISHTLRELDAESINEEHMKNTSLSEVVLHEGKWKCELYNCVVHLEE